MCAPTPPLLVSEKHASGIRPRVCADLPPGCMITYHPGVIRQPDRIRTALTINTNQFCYPTYLFLLCCTCLVGLSGLCEVKTPGRDIAVKIITGCGIHVRQPTSQPPCLKKYVYHRVWYPKCCLSRPLRPPVSKNKPPGVVSTYACYTQSTTLPIYPLFL